MKPEILRKRLRRVVLCLVRYGPITGSLLAVKSLIPNRMARVRLPGFRAPLTIRGGTSDWPTFEKVFLERQYRYEDDDFRPRLIIDAGANVGYSSVYFAQRYPHAKVFALEPERANFEMLVHNTRAYPAVTPLHAALWSEHIPLAIANPSSDAWAFQVTPAPAGEAGLLALTVTDVLAMAGTEHIDILKMDIEGAEIELFRSGYEAWLGQVRLLIMELHDGVRPGASRTVYRALTRYSFAQFPLGENLFVIMDAEEPEKTSGTSDS